MRVSIEALPPATKRAMLEGVRSGPIITGAYTSNEGTCPMLAAHRRGGRTSLGTFARAWDGYTGAAQARLATARELRALETMLETSLADEGVPCGASELGRAISEHHEVRERQIRSETIGGGEYDAGAPLDADTTRCERLGRTPEAAPGDPDRSHELRTRSGWAWLRVFRRYDEYEAALAEALEDGSNEPSESLVGAAAEK